MVVVAIPISITYPRLAHKAPGVAVIRVILQAVGSPASPCRHTAREPVQRIVGEGLRLRVAGLVVLEIFLSDGENDCLRFYQRWRPCDLRPDWSQATTTLPYWCPAPLPY